MMCEMSYPGRHLGPIPMPDLRPEDAVHSIDRQVQPRIPDPDSRLSFFGDQTRKIIPDERRGEMTDVKTSGRDVETAVKITTDQCSSLNQLNTFASSCSGRGRQRHPNGVASFGRHLKKHSRQEKRELRRRIIRLNVGCRWEDEPRSGGSAGVCLWHVLGLSFCQLVGHL